MRQRHDSSNRAGSGAKDFKIIIPSLLILTQGGQTSLAFGSVESGPMQDDPNSINSIID